MKDIKVIVATHKKYDMPRDEMYLPVHVGAEGKKDSAGNDLDLGYVKDNKAVVDVMFQREEINRISA